MFCWELQTVVVSPYLTTRITNRPAPTQFWWSTETPAGRDKGGNLCTTDGVPTTPRVCRGRFSCAATVGRETFQTIAFSISVWVQQVLLLSSGTGHLERGASVDFEAFPLRYSTRHHALAFMCSVPVFRRNMKTCVIRYTESTKKGQVFGTHPNTPSIEFYPDVGCAAKKEVWVKYNDDDTKDDYWHNIITGEVSWLTGCEEGGGVWRNNFRANKGNAFWYSGFVLHC